MNAGLRVEEAFDMAEKNEARIRPEARQALNHPSLMPSFAFTFSISSDRTPHRE